MTVILGVMVGRSFAWVAGLAAVAVGVCACSSGGGGYASSNTSTRPRSGLVVASFNPVPGPSSTVRLRRGLLLLGPTAASDSPALTAAAAFHSCGGPRPAHHEHIIGTVRPPDVELVRATIKDYGQAHANGTVTPFVGNRLVWIIWYKALTVLPIGGPPKHTTASTQPPKAPTPGRQDEITFVDAHTGACLLTDRFPHSG